MSECLECGADDWGYYHCTFRDGTYLVEACLQCTAVKPEGLIEPLMDAIREEMTSEEPVGLDVEVVLETDSDKLERIDACVLEILTLLKESDDNPKLEGE